MILSTGFLTGGDNPTLETLPYWLSFPVKRVTQAIPMKALCKYNLLKCQSVIADFCPVPLLALDCVVNNLQPSIWQANTVLALRAQAVVLLLLVEDRPVCAPVHRVGVVVTPRYPVG